jgi:hypothetical protein
MMSRNIRSYALTTPLAQYMARVGAEENHPFKFCIMGDEVKAYSGEVNEAHGKVSIYDILIDPETASIRVRASADGMTVIGSAFCPTDAEQEAISTAWKTMRKPKYLKPLRSEFGNGVLPKTLAKGWSADFGSESKSPRQHLYFYLDADDPTRIAMIEQRIEHNPGEKVEEFSTISESKGKRYVRWSCWETDDGIKWIDAHPLGPKLPLYNAHLVTEGCNVMIHEGAKAAKHAQRIADSVNGAKTKIIDSLPEHKRDEKRDSYHWAVQRNGWAEELAKYVHVGFSLGSSNAHHTNFEFLNEKRVRFVLVCPDNDEVGSKSKFHISKSLMCEVAAVQFDSRYYKDDAPISSDGTNGFDMADPFPVEMFYVEHTDGEHHYHVDGSKVEGNETYVYSQIVTERHQYSLQQGFKEYIKKPYSVRKNLIPYKLRYKGDSLNGKSCQIITWAADKKMDVEGREYLAVRDSFLRNWFYVKSKQEYTPRNRPSHSVKRNDFAADIGGYTDHVRGHNLATLVSNSQANEVFDYCYEPGAFGEVVGGYFLQDDNGHIAIVNNTRYVNRYRPPSIVPKKFESEKDIRPWLEFIHHLFPNEHERAHVCRWISTVVARPDLRPAHALVLISERQGTGKTTLSEILRKLVGSHNAYFPSSEEISSSQFTEWKAEKRLIAPQEFYANSRKVYNDLKSLITDESITVNRKHVSTYTVRNTAALMVVSNSVKAINIPANETDRRWFIPEVTNKDWPPRKWKELHAWLDTGGYAYIAQWCADYLVKGEDERKAKYELSDEYLKQQMRLNSRNAYFGPILNGENSPTTKMKQEVIENSKSRTMIKYERFLDVYSTKPQLAFGISDMVLRVVASINANVAEKDSAQSYRKVIEDNPDIGFKLWKDKIARKPGSNKQHVAVQTDYYNELMARLSENQECEAEIELELRTKIRAFDESAVGILSSIDDNKNGGLM